MTEEIQKSIKTMKNMFKIMKKTKKTNLKKMWIFDFFGVSKCSDQTPDWE